MKLKWIRRRSEEVDCFELEVFLCSDTKLAESVNRVRGWMLLVVCRFLVIVYTLRPSKAGSKELGRSAGRRSRCKGICTAVINLRLPGSVLATAIERRVC